MSGYAYGNAICVGSEFVEHTDYQLAQSSLEVGVQMYIWLIKEEYVKFLQIYCVEEIDDFCG